MLHRATPGEFAALLGLTDRSVPGAVTDLAVAGTRPGRAGRGDVWVLGGTRHHLPRLGSMKRVAAAVGEGSSAVRSVHDDLALHA
ncbi:MAG TPA: hypothetical protein VKQ71_03960 [Acidimicrobiales bacterium]|nr:hypothetical protein [Acidimicrobiales bacterium]